MGWDDKENRGKIRKETTTSKTTTTRKADSKSTVSSKDYSYVDREKFSKEAGDYTVVYGPDDLSKLPSQQFDPKTNTYYHTDKDGKRIDVNMEAFRKKHAWFPEALKASNVVAQMQGLPGINVEETLKNLDSPDPKKRAEATKIFQTTHSRMSKHLGLPQYFTEDETPTGIDSKFGNYTENAPVFLRKTKQKIEESDGDFEVGAKSKESTGTPDELYNPLIGQPYDFPDEPFIQDLIKTAAARKNYYSIPDEMAWSAKATPHLMDYVLRSPERALAANSEGYNIAAQQLGNFGGRAALSSQLSQLSGKHAANAADILAQVEGQNVATTNQAYGVNADILNRFGMYDAENATSQYYDQMNLNRAKQSAKNKAWNEWTDNVVSTIDNQAKAYNINTLNPEYGIYGSTGGKIYRTPYDRGMKPSQTSDDTALAKRYTDLRKLLPDASEETIRMMVGIGK